MWNKFTPQNMMIHLFASFAELYEQPEFSPIKHTTQQGVAVSVIITSRNNENSIEQCLKSVLAQTLENIQIYIID